jgi:hypothetical protein
MNNNILDLSENAYDIYQNINELKNSVTDLSGNVAEKKSSNDLQELKIFGHGLQISANTDEILAMATRFNCYSNWNKYSGYTYNYFDNIRIDLSAYLLKINFDLLFNDISNNKQNYFTFIEPLIKKISVII